MREMKFLDKFSTNKWFDDDCLIDPPLEGRDNCFYY